MFSYNKKERQYSRWSIVPDGIRELQEGMKTAPKGNMCIISSKYLFKTRLIVMSSWYYNAGKRKIYGNSSTKGMEV